MDRRFPFEKLRIASIFEMATRPLVVPEPFTGEGSWDDWIDHFESAAAVNKWNAEDKLLWLRVRMTGRAQKAYKNLSGEAKSTYELCKKGLQERFEPDSRKELYLSEFHARRKRKTEDWPSFAEDIKSLAERAFANLEEAAREHLALTHYLGQLDNPQVAFSVKQKRPKTVDEAVAATLEMESYLLPRTGRVGQVGLTEPEPATTSLVASVQSKQDALMDMVRVVMERLDKLETTKPTPPQEPMPPKNGGNPRSSQRAKGEASAEKTNTGARKPPQPFVCFKCGKEGHIARGCRAQRPQQQGN